MSSLRQKYLNQVADVDLRNRAIRANAQFTVGTVVSGGERHLLDFWGGAIASRNFGGAVGIGDLGLNRSDSGQSYFYVG